MTIITFMTDAIVGRGHHAASITRNSRASLVAFAWYYSVNENIPCFLGERAPRQGYDRRIRLDLC
jgi:hypothetical protein